MTLPIGLGYQYFYRLADQLTRLVAKELLGLAVRGANATIGTGQQLRIRRRMDYVQAALRCTILVRVSRYLLALTPQRARGHADPHEPPTRGRQALAACGRCGHPTGPHS